MPDHAENLFDAPIGQGLHHEIANRTKMFLFSWHANIDAIVACLDLEGLDPVVITRRLAGDRVVVPPVPRATQEPVLDRALTERPALVRAMIVESAIAPFVAGHAERPVATGDRFDPALGQLIRVEYLGPYEIVSS